MSRFIQCKPMADTGYLRQCLRDRDWQRELDHMRSQALRQAQRLIAADEKSKKGEVKDELDA